MANLAPVTPTPTDVAVSTATPEAVTPGVLTTWTRTLSAKGVLLALPITVGYIPAADPGVRAAQEADLRRHLDERTPDA